MADKDAVKVKESSGPAGFHASDGGQEDDPAIQAEILHGQMLVLASLKKTKMAYGREEQKSLISSFNKDQRKYGSTSTYVNRSERLVTYEVQPGDTLQGISLKNNVTMEQLRRINRLWTNDSVALRGTLLIPVPVEPGQPPPPQPPLPSSASLDSLRSSCSAQTQPDRSEQSGSDFLSSIDAAIASSRRNVRQLESSQALCEQEEEDVLFVRPSHSRLRRHLYPTADPAAVPVTTVRSARSQARHNDIFEL